MKAFAPLLAAALFIAAGAAQAGPVDPNASAARWSNHSFGERSAYATKVSTVCSGPKCGSVEIRACMDEALQPPVPAAAKGMTIGEAAVTCIRLLK